MDSKVIECPSGLKASWLEEGVYLPLVLTPETADLSLDAALTWLKTHEGWLSDALKQYGGILFRDFPIQSAENFQAFVAAINNNMLPYTMGQSARSRVLDKVYTSTEFPADQRITLHCELSYTSNPPRRIFFYCDTPAAEGGETPIADGRVIYQKIDPAIREMFETKQVRYVKNMHGSTGFGRSWQQHFETDDKAEVEAYLTENNVEYVWREDGSLQTFQVIPGVMAHPDTQEKVWHNQAHLWHYSNYGSSGEAMVKHLGENKLPLNAYYGDGSPIDPADLEAIRQLQWEQATFFRWQRGDVMMLDNLMVCHGRNTFKGERQILVALTT